MHLLFYTATGNANLHNCVTEKSKKGKKNHDSLCGRVISRLEFVFITF